MRWTATMHVPWALALGLALRPWLGWAAALIAVVAWAAPVWALRPLVAETLPDSPRPRWRVNWLERPFLVHWTAVHVVVPGWLAGTVAWSLGPCPGADPWWWALAAYGAAWVVFAWGAFITPLLLRVRHLKIEIPGLPAAFEGYRIAHLSDLHVGGFTHPETVARWIRRAQREAADLCVITGDLVTSGVAFHEVIAQHVGELSSPDGVVFVPGNHDYFGEGQPLFGELERRGVRVLRNQHFMIERMQDRMIIAGVDDVWTERLDLHAALQGRPAGTTVLLAHDPAVFDEAIDEGVSLVLSGHTHGGQLAVPGLARWINLTRLSHRYSLGIYRRSGCTLVVSGGLGFTGLPIRVGVRPEVLILRLVASPSNR